AASPRGPPPNGAAPKRKQCPGAGARKTATCLAYPAATAAAALATAAATPPPPVQAKLQKLSSRSPSAAASRFGSFWSLAYEAKPSISDTSIPASSATFIIAWQASGNSLIGDPPRL